MGLQEYYLSQNLLRLGAADEWHKICEYNNMPTNSGEAYVGFAGWSGTNSNAYDSQGDLSVNLKELVM
jgi:hypothetical protein